MADNKDIDIAYIVTPNGLHPQYAIAAAKAGKHVIIEKPMANTAAECDAILAACKAAGNADRAFIFGSTSKISFAGGGVGERLDRRRDLPA